MEAQVEHRRREYRGRRRRGGWLGLGRISPSNGWSLGRGLCQLRI